ncbi:MAG: hypothetical protein K6B38_11060 [Ruminococcus sp.]|nr:hypothetical protein [Ruminococcus sp.]
MKMSKIITCLVIAALAVSLAVMHGTKERTGAYFGFSSLYISADINR